MNLKIESLSLNNKDLLKCLSDEQRLVKGGNYDSYALVFSLEYSFGAKPKGGEVKLTLDKYGKNIVDEKWILK